MFNQDNGIPIKTWTNDKRDKELYNMTPVLEFLAYVDDVRDYIKKFVYRNEINYHSAYSIIKTHSNEYPRDEFSSYSPTRSPTRTGFAKTPSQNININIINKNYSNIYLGQSYNITDKTSRSPKIIDEKRNDNFIPYTSGTNLFRSSYDKIKDNPYGKVSTSVYTPTQMNSNLSFGKTEISRDKPVSSTHPNYNTNNLNTYKDKLSTVPSSKRNDQLTPSRSYYSLAKAPEIIKHDELNDKKNHLFLSSVNKSNPYGKTNNYVLSNLNNKNDKITTQIKMIENEILARTTDTKRNQVSKSLEKSKTSDLRLKYQREDEVNSITTNSISDMKSYTPLRSLNQNEKSMTYSNSFFDRNTNINLNPARSVERGKVTKSPSLGKIYSTNNYNTVKYDDLKPSLFEDSIYSSKLLSNGKQSSYNDHKIFRSYNETSKSATRENKMNNSDKDLYKFNNFSSYDKNSNIIYSQTFRDRFNQTSVNKYYS